MCVCVCVSSGWLSPEDDSLGYVTRIDQRVEDVTGLTMETAEQLQVVNYGIGGHYEPHYDFARVSLSLSLHVPLKPSKNCLVLILLFQYCWRARHLQGNTIENRGCLFIYMFGRMYVILYVCVSSLFNPVPNFTEQNPLVIDHYPYHPRN